MFGLFNKRKVHSIDVYNPQEVMYTIFKEISMYHKEDLNNINGFIISDYRVSLDTVNKDFMNEFSVSVRGIYIDYKDKGVQTKGHTMSIQIKGNKLPQHQYKEKFEEQVGTKYFGMTQGKKLFKLEELDRSDLYIMYVPKEYEYSKLKVTNPKPKTSTVEEMVAYSQNELSRRYQSKNKIRMGAYGLYVNKHNQSDFYKMLTIGNPASVKYFNLDVNGSKVPCYLLYNDIHKIYMVYTVTHLFTFEQGKDPKVTDFYEEVLDDVSYKLHVILRSNPNNGVGFNSVDYGANYKNIYTKSREVKPYSQNMY